MRIKIGARQLGIIFLILAAGFALGYLAGYAFSHWL